MRKNITKMPTRRNKILALFIIIFAACLSGAFFASFLSRSFRTQNSATETDAIATAEDAAENVATKSDGIATETDGTPTDATETDAGKALESIEISSEEKQALLEGINSCRAEHGYMEEIVAFDEELNASAQTWAEYLAKNNSAQHSAYENCLVESIHRGTVDGEANILDEDVSAWKEIGCVACVNTKLYKYDHIGVGVAVTEDGYSIIVIQGK